MSLFTELKRRNVFRVAAAYVVVGWLLLQVSETLVPALHLPDWFHSGVAFLLIIGFPLALIFAWAFEMTPDGIRREKDVDRSQSITHVTGQKLNTAITVLLVVAVAYFALDKFVLDPRRDAERAEEIRQQAQSESNTTAESREAAGPDEHSIAVLPLADLSPAGDSEYFSDGLTEELLNVLARIGELRVAGRTSSFAFKGRNEDLREIAAELNVRNILEGSVRKDQAGNRVRITLQLIDAKDGYHLWSETYDRDLDDIFVIQEDVAREVAGALKVQLLGSDESRLGQVRRTGADTYDLYLQALQNIRNGSFGALDEALELLQRVLTQDADYTPAKLALAYARIEMANTGAISIAEAVKRGLPLVQDVLEQNPDNSEAYVNLAQLRAMQNDDEAAEQAFVRALELDPDNARALGEYGRFLFDRGSQERGMELMTAAFDLDPLSVRVLWDLCQTHAYLGHSAEALEFAERIARIDPDSPFANYGPALAHLHNGDIVNGMKGYVAALEQDPNDYEMLGAMALFWAALGDADRAEDWLQRAEAIGAGQPIPVNARLHLYLLREQHDLARRLVRDALAQNLDNRHGSQFFFRQINAYESVLADDPQAGLKPFAEFMPWAFEEEFSPPEDLALYVNDLIYVADLLRRAEPLSERPAEIIAAVKPSLDRYPPAAGRWTANYRAAQLAAIAGEGTRAVELLELCYEKGLRVHWRQFVQQDPVIARVHDDPKFAALQARFEAEMERQRERAYEELGVNS